MKTTINADYNADRAKYWASIEYDIAAECGLAGVVLGVLVWIGSKSFLVGLIVGILCFAVPLILRSMIAESNSRTKDEQEQKRLDEQYEQQINADNQRVTRELAVRSRLVEQRELLYSQYQRTNKTLKRFYDVGILYGKYHNNFIAVSSFLDYIKSGMCSTLEERYGRDGAYNTFEELCRLDKIIYKLDQVLIHLEQIKENQWTIYNAIREGNSINAKLVDSSNRLAAANEQIVLNSAIAAYNIERSANELNQIKWLQLLEQLQ